MTGLGHREIMIGLKQSVLKNAKLMDKRKKNTIIFHILKFIFTMKQIMISVFGAEVTESSTNKQHHLFKNQHCEVSHYKAIFRNQSKRWFDRLRRQIIELWMQEIFKKFPIEGITDAKKNPYFELKLSKQEIANFAAGIPDEHGHRYCLPANCYKQLDENNMDVSLNKTVNPELWKFREQFFSNDVNKDGTPVVSKLCVALFRLRKICAFIRKAHEYEIVDEEGKTSGNTAKIEELRESINESPFVPVLAANMQRSINEFVV